MVRTILAIVGMAAALIAAPLAVGRDTPPGDPVGAPQGTPAERHQAASQDLVSAPAESSLILRLPPILPDVPPSPAIRAPHTNARLSDRPATVPGDLALPLVDLDVSGRQLVHQAADRSAPELHLPAGVSTPSPEPVTATRNVDQVAVLSSPPLDSVSPAFPLEPTSGPPATTETPRVAPVTAPDAPTVAEPDQAAPREDAVATPPVSAPLPEVPATAARSSPTLSPEVLSGSDPVKVVTIPLGQSRRWTLDHHATAVFAATPEIADVRLLSPNVLYVIGRGVGRTSVAVLDDEGLLDEWLVTTVLDLEPVHALLASDPEFDRVQVQHFLRGVTLTGEVDSVATAERAERQTAAALSENAILENEIRVTAPQQVNLEVQIAEVQRSVTESLGINWEAFNRVGRSGELLWKVGRAQFLSPLSGLDALATLPTGFVSGQNTSSIAGRYSGSLGAVQGVVDALSNAGLANVLARPNLTAISGETASFFSGGEYPLPVGFKDGVIVFEYKKYGVLLDFVPTVVDADRITLTVRPEVSETSDSQSLVTVGTEIPVINVRRAETTVEVGNGESIVIAGLFRSGSNTVESGLPGLKDLPVFGLLFRQDKVEASETELIIVVTANLVRTGAQRLAAVVPAHWTRQLHGYHY